VVDGRDGGIDERFAGYVRERGDHLLRMAVLLTGDWHRTGTAYTFTVTITLTGPLHTTVGLSGTIDVDRQGRVRQLDAVESFMGTVRKVEITFGDFGLPVSVSPPPAGQTFVP
jgi:hypothetical protein